jgi:hypothetical protein
MRRPSLPEAVLLFLAILFLMVPSLQAGEPGPDVRAARSASFDSSPWDLLTRMWGFLTAAWSENGCEADPSGRCLPAIDNGCEFDPDGHCLPHQGTATADNGCEFDPSGRCGG